MTIRRGILCLFVLTLTPRVTRAEEIILEIPARWEHESEASIVLASGNSDTQTYSLKQATQYSWSKNILKLSAMLLLGRTAGIENSRSWELGLRYERELTQKLSGYTAYKIDGNIFASRERRHSVDVGTKYFLIKTDAEKLFSEVGYRFTTEALLAPVRTLDSHFGRIYFEWTRDWTKNLKSRLFVEYLPNLGNAAEYQANAEPSLITMLSERLSLKLSFLMQYRNTPAAVGLKRLDTLYSTSLVAKF